MMGFERKNTLETIRESDEERKKEIKLKVKGEEWEEEKKDKSER